MKRSYKLYTLLLAGITLMGTGCKKFLNVNKDPNNPLSVSESLILNPVEITTGTNVTGGFYGTTCDYWMQYLSLNEPSPDAESYLILPLDVDNTWTFFEYPNVFENLKVMIGQAEAAGHNQYAAIGKILFAYNLAITTDLWGDIPYSQAFDIVKYPKPAYDPQESIYGDIQNLLDSGIYYAGQPPSAVKPGTEDFIYGGTMAAWTKFAYALKARYYIHLTKAPGRTASVQADSALAALANAFTSNDDNAQVNYPGTTQAETPWWSNTQPGAGGVVMAASFIDSLQARNDPRLPVIADTGKNGTYLGRTMGDIPSTDPTVFSSFRPIYGGYLPLEKDNSGTSAPLYLMTYSEALFIKAEATFIKSGATAAQPIYNAAIAAHMDMLGIGSGTSAAYIASRPLLTTGNAIQQIITEKYVANFLNPESWNDWRRTGFPTLSLVQNAYVNYIPRHWPIAQTETLTNPQPQQNGITTASRVWWDAP